MAVLVLNRSPLARRPYHEWLADAPDGIVLLTSRRGLDQRAESLPTARVYLHAEAVTDYESGTGLRDRALALARRYDIRGVVAMHERDLEVAGAIRDALDLPGQSYASANAFRDKLVMKKYAMSAGVPVAPHAEVDSPESLREFASDVGFPVVVKPRDGSGSVGVRILRDRRDVEDFLSGPERPGASGGTGLLAEGFVRGQMYHVDGMVVNNAVVAAWPSIYLYRPGTADRHDGLRFDVNLDPDDPLTGRLVRSTERLLDALPTPPHTTFHAELFVTPDDEVVLCEIASRNGGNLIQATLKTMYGVHFPSTWVRLCAGVPVQLPGDGGRMLPRVVTGQATLLKRPGTVVGYPAAPPFPWVEAYETRVPPGRTITAAANSADLMAGYVVSGSTRRECEDRLRRFGAWFLAGLRFTGGPEFTGGPDFAGGPATRTPL